MSDEGETFREPLTVGAIIADLYLTPRQTSDQRYPIVRNDTRRRLPSHIWVAVYRRDIGRTCQLCGHSMRHLDPEHLQVDHVTPWSAGGSDRTDNLRLTHAICNARRSNFHHDQDREQLPIAHHCRTCYEAWLEVRSIDDVPKVRVWCDTCRRTSRAHPEWVM